MSETKWGRFEELLAGVLEVPAAEQKAFLEANCDDPDLRDEVIELLANEAQLATFLERPAAALVESGELEQPPQPGPGLAPPPDLPKTIGPFRIREVLGEGGMGVVYLAEQDEPVHRELAVKVVRADVTLPEVQARFSAERQALARLSHPAIAQMHEAGTTRDGHPYFAMELVTGLPITQFCDRNCLSVEDRLELFVQVCEGVQHAHHRGIIHRDLKPSNVLVTELDGVLLPKIIDFGIAKALDHSFGDITRHMGKGIMGNLAYMSPESMGIFSDSPEVDTRSDVYALGVLLYELLSGARPFKTSGGSVASVIAKVSIQDAKPPSAKLRVQTQEFQELIAERRRRTPEALLRRLRGDLDWIVAKAIARHREDRYHSPADLIGDIRRHLSNQPVLARAPSLGYRLGPPRPGDQHRTPGQAAAGEGRPRHNRVTLPGGSGHAPAVGRPVYGLGQARQGRRARACQARDRVDDTRGTWGTARGSR